MVFLILFRCGILSSSAVSDSFVRSTSSDCNVSSSLSLVNSSLASLVVGASLSFYRGFPLLLVSGSFLILIGVGVGFAWTGRCLNSPRDVGWCGC